MKIIQIIENLDKGAVENWLVNVFLESRRIKPGWEWTFYCILGKPGRLDEKVIAAGGKIVYSPVTISDKISFLRNLRKTLLIGKFDIIHTHHDYLSGFYMLSAIGLKFKKRILHIHNNDKGIPVGNKILHRILLPVFRGIGIKMNDVILCISEHTLTDFKMDYAKKKPSFEVLYYGINMEPFNIEPDKEGFHKSINIPIEGKVLLYTGRMITEKNPEFVVHILYNLLKKRKDVYAVFVGKGPLEASVKSLGEDLGILEHIRLIGWSDMIPNIMRSSDVFVFPRLEYPKEGLGLVVVEAQTAGLPVFISEGIVEDAIILKDSAYYNKLSELWKWVKEIDDTLNKGSNYTRSKAYLAMKSSKFELNKATLNLMGFYEQT